MEPIFIISAVLAAFSVGGIGITLLLIALGKIKG
jgi:hypothetical protein